MEGTLPLLKAQEVGADLPVRPPLPFAVWCGDLLVNGDVATIVQAPAEPVMERSDVLGMIANKEVDIVEHTPLEEGHVFPVIIFPDLPPEQVNGSIERGLKHLCNGGVIGIQTKKAARLNGKLLKRKDRWSQQELTWRFENDSNDEVFYAIYNEYIDKRRFHATIHGFRTQHKEGDWRNEKATGNRVFIKDVRVNSAKRHASYDYGVCSDIWEETELVEKEHRGPRKDDLLKLWMAEYEKNADLIGESGESPIPEARTIYIVGAGPSLDRNWEALRDVKEGMILCVNKALTKLWSHGIKASRVMTSDVRCAADWGIGVNTSEVDAWMGVHTGNEFAKLNWRNRNWYRMTPDIEVNRVSKKRFPHLPCLTSGVSTTACATSLAARVLRKTAASDPMVVFVGQDMCYPGGKYHAKGAEVPHDNAVLSTASLQVRWLQGLDGNWYWTSKAFSDARIMISIQASFLWRHGVRVVNASESPAAALRVGTAEGKIELLPLKDIVAEREATVKSGARDERAA